MLTLDIGCDLDGVCYDFEGALKYWLVVHKGFDPTDLPLPSESWNFWKHQWGMTVDEFLSHCDEGVDAGVIFNYGHPYPDTVQTLNRLHDAGHRIHMVTSRRFGVKSHHNTSDWLTKHKIPFDSLIFSGQKSLFRPDIFIDDYEKNYNELWSVGIETWMMDRPWNEHVNTVVRGKNYRIKTWEEFEQAVERKAKGTL